MYQSNMPPQNAPPDPKDLVDPKVLLGWCILFLGFIKKRKWVPVISTVVALVLAVAALQVLPRTYESEVTMQAKRSEYLSPDSGRLIDDANVVLHRRVVLLDMVKRTNLVEEWKKRREPLFRLKDKIYASLLGPTADKDLEQMLASMLHDALTVSTEGDTITILVSWRDPELAFELVSAAQQAFLEERHVQEVAMLSEAMKVLENHAAKLEREIKDQIEKAQAVVQQKNKELKEKNEKTAAEVAEKMKAAGPAVVAPRPASLVAQPEVSQQDLDRLKMLEGLIAKKREEIDGVTGASRAALSDLQGKLAQARAIYKEAHPVIQDLKQRIQIASADPPGVARARSELNALENEHAALQSKTSANAFLGPKTGGTISRAGPRLGANVLEGLRQVEAYQLDDPDIDYARSQIGFSMRKYQDTQLSIDSARIDLDTAQAAFQHRYRVVTPAEEPNKPTKPQPAKVIMGALIGGLFLGLFIVLASELRRGLIHEPWQVETSLGLPVVANIDLGSKSHGF